MRLVEQGTRGLWHYYNLIDGNIIGCVCIKQDKDFFIANFLIDDKYQGQGYGTHLMNMIIEKAKGRKIILEVNQDNEKAIHFYKKFNFVQVGESDNKYILELNV